MLRSLIESSIRFRPLVMAFAIGIAFWGARAIERAPVDVFPEFAPPIVEVQTEAPGLSASEVESVISVPLESALNGVSGLKTLRSKSVMGLSSIVMIFDRDAELRSARQLVQERLSVAATRLPSVARVPVILQPLSSLSRVMKIGVSSKKLSAVELTTLIKWSVRPHLLAVPGVANVAIWGERDRELEVTVSPERLAAHDVSIDQLAVAVRSATSAVGGGFVDTPNQRLAVRHAPSVRGPDDLAASLLERRSDGTISIGDVADVAWGYAPPIGSAVINDGPGLLLIVEKQRDANTLSVTRGVEAAIESMLPSLKDVEIDPTIFRPATFVERSISNLSRAVLQGCALVALVILFFLFEWRSAIVSLTAIPISVLSALAFLEWRGAGIDVMVLSGLVLAVGEVVDDALIDVENISRRLRENRLAGSTEPIWKTVLAASLEVRSAVVYASVIVAVVFMPVLFLEGTAGVFFRPLALSYLLAVGASLVVALTVTPALAVILCPGGKARSEPPIARWVASGYKKMLGPVVRHPWIVMIGVLIVFAGAVQVLRGLGEELLPDFKETDFLMHWVEKPGTSLEAMERITERAGRELRTIPGVRNFGSHIGRAEVADEVVGPNFTELWISLDPNVDYDATIARVAEVVQGYPGLQRDLLTYLRERIKEVLSGASASIVVRIFGPDLDVLRERGQAVASVLRSIDGVADLKVEAQALVPQVEIRVKSEVAALFGLTADDIRRSATTLMRGSTVGELFEDQKVYPVAIRGAESLRRDPHALAACPIALPGGGWVAFGDVAEVSVVAAPNEIKREGASRRIDVTLNVKGRDLGGVARDVETKMKNVTFAREYYSTVLGEHKERQESRDRIFLLAGIALAGVFVVLLTDFGSFRLAALSFLTLPFALAGGIFAARITGGILSLGSIVGFVTVLGIAARNGIMLFDRWRRLEVEGMSFGPELIIQGAVERITPILMTALSTALALVPIAIAGNRAGHEIEHPLAVVILGGLVTSTILNLVAAPAIYSVFGARHRRSGPA